MARVLIAEDDLRLQRFLRTRLEMRFERLEIILAENGEEAIRLLEHREISLLITDIQMPKVDGLELLAYMNNRHPDVPCIVMTAYATQETKKQLAGQTYRILSKPFRLEDLARAITQALESDIPGGHLRGISVASFAQMIAMEQKTCILQIAGGGGRKGLLYFEDGELYDAIYRHFRGEEAAVNIIAMDRVKIRLAWLPSRKIHKKIHTGLTTLIMEAMRRKDESNASKEGEGLLS
jgi:CheY-like chemotaxis protein